MTTRQQWLETAASVWESDACLFWPFAVGSHGYGVLSIGGQLELAHRHVCRLAHGDPPTSLHQAAHSCGKDLCINKRHLRWATRRENESDKLIHGTLTRGTRHGHAKLTDAQVLAIREAGGPQRRIAHDFGICQQTVSDIKARRRWAWL